MAVKTTVMKGRTAMLALAAASLALPAAAFAQDQDRQDRGRGGQRAERAQSDNGNNGGERRSWGSRSDANRSGGGGQTPAWGARNEQSRGNGGEARAWGRNGGNPASNAQQTQRGYASRGPGAWQQAAPAVAPAETRQAQRSALPGPWGRAQDNARRDNDRSGSWSGRDSDRGRNTTYTNRDGNWSRDNNRYRDNNNTRYSEQWRNDRSRSGSYYSNNNNRYRQGLNGNFSNWDRRWRDNNRYNWYSYRRTNPSIYRWGTYYSPYRNYSYRRLSIGFTLDSLFYGSRYWINDPWQYRLPDVYGPYRWVRYYDDALLVNVYDGEVVDVIYDFFW